VAVTPNSVTIEKWVYGGEALARIEGRVVLAPFVLPGESVRLNVDGGIHAGPGPYTLNLGITNAPDRPADPLTNAVVTITDDKGLQEPYVEVGKGRYQLNGTTVQGTPGVGYVLDIRLPNGKVYHSTTEIMPDFPLAVDSPYWKIMNEKVVSSEGIVINNILMEVFLTSHEPPPRISP